MPLLLPPINQHARSTHVKIFFVPFFRGKPLQNKLFSFHASCMLGQFSYSCYIITIPFLRLSSRENLKPRRSYWNANYYLPLISFTLYIITLLLSLPTYCIYALSSSYSVYHDYTILRPPFWNMWFINMYSKNYDLMKKE